ncbi:hypothetical protein CHL78_014285 [Romboutsia weinsteinii]|uniref:DUF4181 domain-containing protein n=1 Tax=Romboutsia weinsteinii TaxID=2020949 RepID=A0A371J0D5_9FIRM|nr:hypothetical protein [Romboutsia weinsteinii]RDY26262.1 hypothetical protein CHL78_014285 [Romboutsia weinsteinii]
MDNIYFVLIILLGVLILVPFLGRYLLKRKLNPNKEYLNEIKGIKKIKRLRIIDSISIFILLIIPYSNKRLVLLIIILTITEVIRNKYTLNYLDTKDENTDTRKYILYDFGFQMIVIIVIIIINYYFLT